MPILFYAPAHLEAKRVDALAEDKRGFAPIEFDSKLALANETGVSILLHDQSVET